MYKRFFILSLLLRVTYMLKKPRYVFTRDMYACDRLLIIIKVHLLINIKQLLGETVVRYVDN